MNEICRDFDNTMKKLTHDEQEQFLDWIASKWIESDNEADQKEDENECEGISKLRIIAAHLRDKLPFGHHHNNAVLTQDVKRGKLFVDEFLYDDRALEKLREENRLLDHYCADCGSSNVKQFELVSHSCSLARVELMFKELLGPLEGMSVLDVGSGVGALLYGAHALTSAHTITGVELDPELSRLSRQTLMHHGMTDRADVVNADITTQPSLLREADVVIVCNTFEYFAESAAAAVVCWRAIYSHVKVGAVLVLSPPAPPTFQAHPIGVEWREWLKELPLTTTSSRPLHALASIAAYSVLSTRPPLPPLPPLHSSS